MPLKRVLLLLSSDLKQIFRDRALLIFVLLPFLLIPLLRWGLPFLTSIYPILTDYHSLILGMLCSVAAIGPGYIVAFIMLDEKDQQLFPALRVMPIPSFWFVLYRMSFITLMGFLFAIITLLGADLIPFSWVELFGISMLVALVSPVISLLCVSFARNKIEGVTLLKGMNMLFVVPLLIMVIDPAWEKLIGIIPVYWTFLAFESWEVGSGFWMSLTIGTLMHLLFLVLSFWGFRRRVFA